MSRKQQNAMIVKAFSSLLCYSLGAKATGSLIKGFASYLKSPSQLSQVSFLVINMTTSELYKVSYSCKNLTGQTQ